ARLSALFACFVSLPVLSSSVFTVTATTALYPLSLHDALPIYHGKEVGVPPRQRLRALPCNLAAWRRNAGALRSCMRCRGCWTKADRKSTRLNSSHVKISYAVFCLKKKKEERPRGVTHKGLRHR